MNRRKNPYLRMPATPTDTDLAIDGVALLDETYSEENKSEREQTPFIDAYDTRGRKTVLAAPSKIYPISQQRINVKLITTEPLTEKGAGSGGVRTPDVNLQEYIREQAGENETHMTPSQDMVRLEPRGNLLGLHDHEEACKNYSVTHEVKEM
mmetsp:Transcript_20117/g.27180  ORF Transcript_20117/g.27180 Transcript_20117/m.27180 type:complete len:152 (+) Transcript_20117:1028-1483(+)|eukprot:CAMPEP_0185598192 /NCGR_PEP_ID=MMETSP0434-20130131/81847_1 /TAXON_ID=626734 ORGANISM="Favella taraikaensis, Strain Fe Narragansett Bay" /NCGR_SAMPLE_ID=MMETSP0434 /ASSEMBLY_ACC=CAM_ASM_000379 /LENGTH=151 /DNA_ID=CAMNT_0028227123 /DNA_START=1027 /DNA_END=1482 /DNA_ORIENTATION=+